MAGRSNVVMLVMAVLMLLLAPASTRAEGLLAQLLKGPLHIPDGYAIDESRDPARFAAPVDRDELVSLDLLPSHTFGNLGLSIACDDESRPAMGHGSTMVRFKLEWPF